jgi:hypothetical protein
MDQYKGVMGHGSWVKEKKYKEGYHPSSVNCLASVFRDPCPVPHDPIFCAFRAPCPVPLDPVFV